MRTKLALVGIVVAASVGAVLASADEMPEFPKPGAEHEWLTRLAGEWESDVKMFIPGQEPVQSKGTETVRALGGFWIIAENRGDMMGMPYTGILTLGYDAEAKKHVGTWVDSMQSHMWNYEGSIDAGKKAITLECEGPNCMQPGTTAKYREVLEVKSADHKFFRSAMKVEGEWVPMMEIEYRRKK